ncbi:hypothetical protein JX266_005060 [Neoarthrinium moseri]|nr:hypothetical protein JX266_005060 [Neoarthrinium moseri]
MVSLKSLCLYGAALITAVQAIPTPSSDTSLAGRDASLGSSDIQPAAIAREILDGSDSTDLSKRIGRGRMTLQWSAQGRIFFMLGAGFPQSIIDSFAQLGEGGPAKGLMSEFWGWALDHQSLNRNVREAWRMTNSATRSAIYGKAGGVISNDFGFGLQTAGAYANPTLAQMQNLIQAIHDWASSQGSVVQVIQRPNDFFSLSEIGASTRRDLEDRARGSTCPKSQNLLQYATKDVSSDLNINRDFRAAGQCGNM